MTQSEQTLAQKYVTTHNLDDILTADDLAARTSVHSYSRGCVLLADGSALVVHGALGDTFMIARAWRSGEEVVAE